MRWGTAGLLGVLALYGCWSALDAIARWGLTLPGVALFCGWIAVVAVVGRRLQARVVWAGVAVAGAALRIGSAWIAAGRVSPGDAHKYIELARHLLSGAGLVMHEPYMGRKRCSGPTLLG